jgi:hypothetical protein
VQRGGGAFVAEHRFRIQLALAARLADVRSSNSSLPPMMATSTSGVPVAAGRAAAAESRTDNR